jgi:hypothetical protein
MIKSTVVLLNTYQKTTCTVVDYPLEGEIYYFLINFTDAYGSTVKAQGMDGGTSRIYRIGQKVPIIYDSNNPKETSRVNNFVNIWLGPIFLTAMGAFDATLSLGLHCRRFKTQKDVQKAPSELKCSK